jgi:hypothetical protein
MERARRYSKTNGAAGDAVALVLKVDCGASRETGSDQPIADAAAGAQSCTYRGHHDILPRIREFCNTNFMNCLRNVA